MSLSSSMPNSFQTRLDSLLSISLSEQTPDTTQRNEQGSNVEEIADQDSSEKQLTADVLASINQALDILYANELAIDDIIIEGLSGESSDNQRSECDKKGGSPTAPNRSSAIDDHHSIPRLLAPGCGGIPERIELLGELMTIGKDAWMSDVYDETALIMVAIERNARLQSEADGQCLLALATAGVSNRNIDLARFDVEIERQFGLHSVEVTGDGACAFRATLISGLARSDRDHTEVRERVLDQVLNHLDYYRTVLKPGERVTEEVLNHWIQTMLDPNTYADEMATIAMANEYHLRLVIFRAGDLLHVINPRDGDVRGTAFVVNVGTHYKALVTRPELEEARRNSERLVKNQ